MYAILPSGQRIPIQVTLEENYVSIEQAAQEIGIHAEILRMLAKDGLVECASLKGEPLGCDLAHARQIAERLNAARSGLEGQGIVATDVPEKYGFCDNSIYRWHKDGWIGVVGKGRRNANLYSEADIAFARALADLRRDVPGAHIFPAKPRSGRPRKQ
jgi:hypothetical protein